MKTRNLFALAFATMAFAACSNEDSPANGGEQAKGELVDAISVKFVSNGSGNTRAYESIENGLEQENKVYHAFVFAKEAAPEHAGARTGDWSVAEVGSANATDPITAGTANGQLGNMATFKGVRQGDNVYVLANYPDLDMARAEVLAHAGEKSEESIKAFIESVQKEYLNKLAFSSRKKDGSGQPVAEATPAATSKYIMAGFSTIPVSPNISNGSTVPVPVKLDREMAKVYFYASVTTDQKYAAAGKVAIKEGDGIIVARVARNVAPYTKQERDWYFPTPAVDKDKDWNVSDWLTAFDGDAQSASDNKLTTTPFFNNALHKETAKEYRYTWTIAAGNAVATGNAPHAYLVEKTLYSPYFYVTPNYSDNAATATVISTQATYVGAPQWKNERAQELFVKAFSVYSAKTPAAYKDSEGNPTTSFSKCVWDDTTYKQFKTDITSFNQEADKKTLAKACGWPEAQAVTFVDEALAVYAKATKVNGLDPTVTSDKETIALLEYYDGMKLYYRADIANYDDTNTVSLKNTERNTFYKIRATITSLGAKSIEDAINSDNISMQVVVEVNPWNVVFNDIQM